MQEQSSPIPISLKPYFQEYDLEDLRLRQDADLIIQRTLEFGNWFEIRWLFQVYRRGRESDPFDLFGRLAQEIETWGVLQTTSSLN